MARDLETGTNDENRLESRYSLRSYLEHVWFPSFKRTEGQTWSPISRSASWPKYPELKRKPGTRLLCQIISIDQWKFTQAVEDYIKQIKDVVVPDESSQSESGCVRLRLPSKDMPMHHSASDLHFFSGINNEDDYVALMRDYVLGTISEAIRLIEDLPPDDPITQALKFQDSSYLCPAHHARWDILTLPGDEYQPVPLAVIFVAPWAFGAQDFHDFTSPQRFKDGAIDILDTKAHTASDKLWAVVHDTCQGRGKYFVVTNYLRWAFGELSPDDTIARITESFESPILELGSKQRDSLSFGRNVAEFLAFWVHSALETRVPHS